MMRALRLLLACLAASACNGRQPASRGAADDDRALCTALCDRLAACGAADGFPGAPACARICIEDQAREPACRDARVAYERCAIPLACDQLRRVYADPWAPGSACAAESAAVIACGGPSNDAAPFIYFQF
jgi:hypothetical protein